MAWEDTHTQNLGITATHVRKIKSGAEYEKYFEPATGTSELINDDATVHDTLDFVGVLVQKTIGDTKKISQVLKRATLDATCHAIFDFFYQNYQYKLDDIGVEQVRRPTRAWADRKTGIDCDCFTASVSSVLTNLGIEHYLKIIAINGKDNFQHIYVVVPKRQGLDINSRANYWVIDPVLNHYNEEAPNITKTKHLKMNGIPLEQLNGLDEVAGLGNEFEGIEEALSGVAEQNMHKIFRERLLRHIRNTRNHINRNPAVVARMYKPHVLTRQLGDLETALSGGSDEQLEAVLEGLSNEEHLAMQPQFAADYDAIHGHDDHLYGVMYGDIDDKMLGTVLGLGRKGRSKAKVKKGNKGKRGFFTKIKNGNKAIKSGKFKGKLKNAIKKVGRFIKKTNPLTIAARGGFIAAMRTNFGKIAEKAYWGYQTREFARSKGITDEYYDACVKVKDKVVKVFVDRLGGNESTIKKPILNGRAAKKIAKLLKAKGLKGTEELFGLGGLGVVTAAAAGTAITAALAFLAPIIKMIKGMKGQKSGLEKDENGNEAETPSEDGATEMQNTEAEASNPATGRRSSTIDNDGSVEAADAANEEEPQDDEESGTKKKSLVKSSGAEKGTSNNTPATTTATDDSEGDDAGSGEGSGEKKSGSGGLIALVALGLLGAAAMASKSDKKRAASEGTNGLGNFSAKRESKNLKAKLTKQGVKMPHGYEVEKRKHKPVKTIKI